MFGTWERGLAFPKILFGRKRSLRILRFDDAAVGVAAFSATFDLRRAPDIGICRLGSADIRLGYGISKQAAWPVGGTVPCGWLVLAPSITK